MSKLSLLRTLIDRFDRSRIPAWVLQAGAVAVFLVGLFAFLHHSFSPMEEAATAFLQALGSGDGKAACARMTRSAQAALVATYDKRGCEQAVAALVDGLSASQRRELASADLDNASIKGNSGYVDVTGNPAQISHLTLTEIDGKWLVSQIR